MLPRAELTSDRACPHAQKCTTKPAWVKIVAPHVPRTFLRVGTRAVRGQAKPSQGPVISSRMYRCPDCAEGRLSLNVMVSVPSPLGTGEPTWSAFDQVSRSAETCAT